MRKPKQQPQQERQRQKRLNNNNVTSSTLARSFETSMIRLGSERTSGSPKRSVSSSNVRSILDNWSSRKSSSAYILLSLSLLLEVEVVVVVVMVMAVGLVMMIEVGGGGGGGGGGGDDDVPVGASGCAAQGAFEKGGARGGNGTH